MSIRCTAVITQESYVEPQTGNRVFNASLSLFDEAGNEIGNPRRLSNYQEVGNLLQREAGVTYEELQDRMQLYNQGQEVRLRITLENDDAIHNLGF